MSIFLKKKSWIIPVHGTNQYHQVIPVGGMKTETKH